MTATIIILGLVASQTCHIVGQVLDVVEMRPVAGAHVLAADAGTTTDESGRFELTLPETPSARLTISHIGYEAKALTATPGPLPRPVLLRPRPIALPEVEVRPGPARPTGTHELSGPAIRRIPGAEKDILRAVQSLPGVSSTGDFFGWLYVRGGTPGENLFLLDGVEMPDPYHYAGLASVFNTALVEEVRLSTGGFGPDRGDRTASVLEVTTRPPRPGRRGRCGVDLTEVEAAAEFGTAGGDGFIAALRHCYLDLLLGRLDLGDGYILPTYTDFQLTARARPAPGLALNAGLLSTRESARAGDSSHWRAPGITLASRGTSGGLKLAWQPSGAARLSFQLSGIDRRQDFEVRDSLGENIRRHWPRNIRAGVLGHLIAAPGWLVEAGGSLASVAYRHESTLPLELLDPMRWGDTCVADIGFRQGDAWARVSRDVLPRLQVSAGARLDARSLDPGAVASPRLQARWQAGASTSLRTAWGIYRQFAAPEHRNADSLALAQPGAARARHLIFGLEQDLPAGITARLDLYDKRLDRLVVVRDGAFTADGTGSARGLELGLTRRQGVITWQGSYAWSRARRSWLHGLEPVPTDGEQPHILNLSGAGRLPGKIDASARLRWSSGAPYTPEVHYYENHCIPGEYNSARYPAYFRLDLRLARRFAIGGHGLDLWLSVLNATNARNVQSWYHDADGTRRAIWMLPRLPMLGLAWEF
ncbi:MAG TPA: hypothetical protein ENN51_03250 [candidate division WOR-3 bacterium]|uniref:TonB-dependent receptor n=1 Tax=candidate division WOR-3 bacterium TaxID=2052148 RepID=A0A7V0T4Z1_UNCW3|nr:hypothetical protein [candidate division WOR-3 bacterium]